MNNDLKNLTLGALLVVAFALPNVAVAQSICEGLTTILTASRDELEFHTVPGAICKISGSDFGCIWQKPGPSGRGSALRQWVNTTIRPDMKKLTGAIQRCIKQEAIPYEWHSFRKDRTSRGFVKGYFAQRKDTNAGRPKTIGVCFEYDNDEVGAGVVLTVRSAPKGKSYCSIFIW